MRISWLIKFSFIFWILAVPSSGHAVVDLKNGNYVFEQIDWSEELNGEVVHFIRTYNSRSDFYGMFGRGWCSEYETKLEQRSDGNLDLVFCGTGLEITLTKIGSATEPLDEIVEEIVDGARLINPNLNEDYLATLRSDLQVNQHLREALALRLGIEKVISTGQEFESYDGTFRAVFRANLFEVQNGAKTEVYSIDGRLLQSSDGSSNSYHVSWKGTTIVGVNYQSGLNIEFLYDPNGNLREVKTNNAVARYEIDVNRTLQSVNDAWGREYNFDYDTSSRLARIGYPDQTNIEIFYSSSGSVTSLIGRDGCVESYSDRATSGRSYIAVDVQKICNNEVTNISSYEFWWEELNGYTYLSRASSVNNGQAVEVLYGPTGQILRQNTDGNVIEYGYDQFDRPILIESLNWYETRSYQEPCGLVRKVSRFERSEGSVIFRAVVSRQNDCSIGLISHSVLGNVTLLRGCAASHFFQCSMLYDIENMGIVAVVIGRESIDISIMRDDPSRLNDSEQSVDLVGVEEARVHIEAIVSLFR